MLGVVLIGEGSECLDSVLVFLDTARRRALLREGGCGRSFLIPCGRASINDQSIVHNKYAWLTYFRLLAPSVAVQLSGCFVLLDAGPYRLEGGGVRSRFILPDRSWRHLATMLNKD